MPHLQSGALVSLLDPLRPQEEPIWAVYPQRRHLLPKVRLLIDKLREELPGALRRSEAILLRMNVSSSMIATTR